jgi:hypothetical protein
MSNTEKTKVPFKDAPIGARFHYPTANAGEVWVKIHANSDGLIVKYTTNGVGQNYCTFVDHQCGVNINTEIEAW